ncbi:MAG: hypothetical protein GY798_03145 [Hyphomicrobiales bacterium]|nr:hypothetical protein [Hyphomicrobiales bacterium]
MKRFFWLSAFLVLTVLSQIGGIALVVAWAAIKVAAPRLTGWSKACTVGIAFAVVYACLTVFVVPPLAALGGRVPLPCLDDGARPYKAATPILCVLNRHYVVPRLADLLDALARDLSARYPGTITLYLDAGFPFLDGFPLIPHLSHDDGRKIDVALWYADRDSGYLPAALRSPIGYGAFERPDPPAPARCDDDVWLTLRWNLTALQPFFDTLAMEPDRTTAALIWLDQHGEQFGLDRVFVEPHLVKQLGIASPYLRFQGCRAARHDDHIHIQIE